MPDFFQYALLALAGACLGSFVSVTASRHIAGGRCMRMSSSSLVGKQYNIENLPLIGWSGYFWRCAHGDMGPPPRRVTVELALAGLLPLAFWRLGATDFSATVPFILLLSIIFLTDLDALTIPDRASLGGVALGLVFAAFETPGLPSMHHALVGGFSGFGLVFGINALYRFWRGTDGIGLGDAKLMGMLGVWLGAQSLLPTLFAASAVAAVFGTILPAQKGKELEPALVPFGCYLVAAALGWLLFAN